MHLIKDDELNIPYQVGTLVEHTTQNLRRHDQTAGLWIYLHISCEDADRRRTKRLLEIAILLVGQGLNRGRINGPEKP